MKYTGIIIAAAALSACTSATPKPKNIGMANPASVYCQKQGGKTDIVKTKNGEVGYCTLPDGERIEEWTLYRRDNK